ncbi:ferredoxin, partial [Nonomuraea sp. NPDC004297]
MRVTVDRDTCCGSGLCVVAVPQVFGHDDETVVVVNVPANDFDDLWAFVQELLRRISPSGSLTHRGLVQK